MGNGASPHGPSYRAHPQLYHSLASPHATVCPGPAKLTYEPSGGIRVMTLTSHRRVKFAVMRNTTLYDVVGCSLQQ